MCEHKTPRLLVPGRGRPTRGLEQAVDLGRGDILIRIERARAPSVPDDIDDLMVSLGHFGVRCIVRAHEKLLM
jgi:hypothetical protein